MMTYEAELTWEPNSSCFGWRYVVYRIEDRERDVVSVGGNYSTREYALGKAQEAAQEDRRVRVYDMNTGKSYNVVIGTNPGTKRREIVPLEVDPWS